MRGDAILQCPCSGLAVLYILHTVLASLSGVASYDVVVSAHYSSHFCISSGFLVGPVSQVKKMFKKVRVVATVVYLTTMAATLIVAFTVSFSPASLLLTLPMGAGCRAGGGNLELLPDHGRIIVYATLSPFQYLISLSCFLSNQ